MSVASTCDVAVVGAGPAGAVAAGILARKGYDVAVLERQSFPRFSIGESLLPQCMTFLEEAGMLGAVEAAGFQLKNGAAFDKAGIRSSFDFADKSADGWSTTFQVQRARFDTILAEEAEKAGAAVPYRREIVGLEFDKDMAVIPHRSDAGEAGWLTDRTNTRQN